MHRDILGHVQQGRGGLGSGESCPFWIGTDRAQRIGLVVGELRRQEEAQSERSGREWTKGSYNGMTCGVWRLLALAFPYVPHTMPCPPPKTLASGMVRILRVLYARCQLI